MKKTLFFLFILISSISFAQITIGAGNAVDSNAGLSTPISNWYNYSLSQTIFLASEIDASGTITSLEFSLNNSNSLDNSDEMIDVWMGYTTKDSFNPTIGANGADIVDVSSLTQVMTNAAITHTASDTVYTLDIPFDYNGTENLIIVVDANEPGNDGSSPLYLQSPTSDIKTMMIRSDTENIDANNPSLNYSGTFEAISWQAKTTRSIITINGLTPLSSNDFENTFFSVYPNPAVDLVSVKSKADIEKIEVYNNLGQLVLVDNNVSSINISTLNSGMYFMQILDKNGDASVEKIIKK